MTDHAHRCECGEPVMEESVAHWQQQRVRILIDALQSATRAYHEEAHHAGDWRSCKLSCGHDAAIIRAVGRDMA